MITRENPSLSLPAIPYPDVMGMSPRLTRTQWRLAAWVLVASMADITSTLWGLSVGMVEQNPLMDWMLNNSLGVFTAIKILLPLALFLLAIRLSGIMTRSRLLHYIIRVRNPNIVAYIMIVVYSLGAVNNFVMMMIMLRMEF